MISFFMYAFLERSRDLCPSRRLARASNALSTEPALRYGRLLHDILKIYALYETIQTFQPGYSAGSTIIGTAELTVPASPPKISRSDRHRESVYVF